MTAGPVAALRVAQPGDLDAVLAIERAVFPRPWSAASLADELVRPDRVWLVVDAGDEVVAFGGVADLAGDAHVLTVAVAEGHRRRGHAARLVAGLLAAAHERFGVTRATLEVRASNAAARALYRRCGFDEVGVRPGYYQDDGEGAVVLWCDDLIATLDPTPRPRPQEDRP